MAVVVPPQTWVELTTQHGYAASYLHFWATDYFRFGTLADIVMPTWNHLWFLPYLWVYTALLAGAAMLPPGMRAQAWFDRAFGGWRALAVPALYLVLRTQELTSEVFVCPSSSAERSMAGATGSNFESGDVLSYSYNNPYPSKTARDQMKGHQATAPASEFALAADLNPGREALLTLTPTSPRSEMMKANSDNHNRDGQNVLYGDGHVEFQSTPFAGERRNVGGREFRDNIYVSGGDGTGVPPAVLGPMADEHDSIVLPAASPASAPSPLRVAMDAREFGARRIVWLSSGVVMLGALGSGGLAVRTARRRRRAGAMPV